MSQRSGSPIWSKRQGAGPAAGPSPRAQAYCAGRDVAARPAADAVLVPYDLWTNRAHSRMLRAQGIIDAKTYGAIRRGLDKLEKEHAAGKFRLDPKLEDVHINIERYVAKAEGEAAAGAIHTARSRNDQVATDMRLWLRDRLLERVSGLADVIDSLAALARREAATLAPGWTHGQPAMPTSFGHWAAAHAWALVRDAQALIALWPLMNQSPLGSAASFGTSWPIDRALTAKLLGFEVPQYNSLDATSTRWEHEARLGAALSVMMTHFSSLAQDLIFLSTPPRASIRLGNAHVTGSSIMPNKRNPDFAEITRARAAAVHALTQSLMSVGRGALSGYNRDSQWTKYWIMDLIDEVGEAPELFAEVVKAIEPDRKALAAQAIAGFSLAADLADRLASTRKLPFRRAYHIVAEAVAQDENQGWIRLETFNKILTREKIKPLFTPEEWKNSSDPKKALTARASLGGPSPADVRKQAAALKTAATAARKWAETKMNQVEKAKIICVK